MRNWLLLGTAPALAVGALLLARPLQAQTVSETEMAGPYSVNLKILPAESFTGPNAAMAWDSGAQPERLSSVPAPNHHMVAFVKRDGQPVQKATVQISYLRLSQKPGQWQILPVARMHVAGKGPETTHFGNNVYLEPGEYEARVQVNGNAAIFRFTLK